MKLRWIIGLMGLSMIGLIAYQLYWIDGLVTANEERFKKDVIGALNNVASKLEKQEAIATYNKLDQLSYREKVAGNKERTYGRQGEQPSFDGSEKKLHLAAEQHQQMFMFYDTVQFGDDFQMTINFFGSSSGLYYPEQPQNSAYSEIQQRDKEIVALENQLERVSKKYELTLGIVEDLMRPRKSLASRFNPNQLDTLLAMELRNKGIDIAYDYGVVFAPDKSFTNVKDDQPNTALLESELKASLFPNDVFDSNGFIVIDFPNKNKFLIGKIWSSLISSGFLVMVILFCFGYSIRTIVHQKKLSEIKNDFINNMTHELKTPIATVSLAVEALSDKEIEGSALKDRYLKI
ncbi:MAG: histidine kinase dimerization/phospho-acceptor domain-containing protein, partial [Bacteroidota bacterium]